MADFTPDDVLAAKDGIINGLINENTQLRALLIAAVRENEGLKAQPTDAELDIALSNGKVG